jgi:hypothetical protein
LEFGSPLQTEPFIFSRQLDPALHLEIGKTPNNDLVELFADDAAGKCP